MMMDDLENAAAELDAAHRAAAKELIWAALPVCLSLFGFRKLRKQRRAVRSELLRQRAVIAGSYQTRPAATVEHPLEAEDRERAFERIRDALPGWARLEVTDDKGMIVNAEGRVLCGITSPISLAANPERLRIWAGSLEDS